MTRIIILNDFAYVNGGASQVALSSALGLAQAGYDVTLFTAVQPIDSTLLNQTGLKGCFAPSSMKFSMIPTG